MKCKTNDLFIAEVSIPHGGVIVKIFNNENAVNEYCVECLKDGCSVEYHKGRENNNKIWGRCSCSNTISVIMSAQVVEVAKLAFFLHNLNQAFIQSWLL